MLPSLSADRGGEGWRRTVVLLFRSRCFEGLSPPVLAYGAGQPFEQLQGKLLRLEVAFVAAADGSLLNKCGFLSLFWISVMEVVTLLLVGHGGGREESTMAARCSPGRRYLLLFVLLALRLKRRTVLLISLTGRGDEEGACGGMASSGSNLQRFLPQRYYEAFLRAEHTVVVAAAVIFGRMGNPSSTSSSEALDGTKR